MVWSLKIGKYNIDLQVRHYWENNGSIARLQQFHTKVFGVFFRRDLTRNHKITGYKMYDTDTFIPSYKFGIQLGWIKIWLNIYK